MYTIASWSLIFFSLFLLIMHIYIHVVKWWGTSLKTQDSQKWLLKVATLLLKKCQRISKVVYFVCSSKRCDEMVKRLCYAFDHAS